MPSSPAVPASSLDAGPAHGLRSSALDGLRSVQPQDPEAFVRRVLITYRRSLDRYLGDLQRACDSGDAAKARLVVHSLKSSSLQIGADDFGLVCGDIEQQILRDGLDHPDLRAAIHSLPAGALLVRHAIDALVGPETGA